MPTYYYDRITARASKSGVCPGCGKAATRSQTFGQTVNPFNRNPDGTVKTAAEVRASVNSEAVAWRDADTPVMHARCEREADDA